MIIQSSYLRTLNIAHNLRNWVKKAHDNLDVNNDVDRHMLHKMALYVERCRKYVIANPFIVDDSDEMELQARDIPTKDQALPPKLKRSRDESNPTLFMPPQVKQPTPPNIFVNDDGNDVFVENIGDTTVIHLTPAFGDSMNASIP